MEQWSTLKAALVGKIRVHNLELWVQLVGILDQSFAQNSSNCHPGSILCSILLVEQ